MAAQKVDRSLWKLHEMLTEGPVDERKVDRSLRKVPWPLGKLMEGPVDTWKVDGRSHGHRESRQKFTDGPMDGRKFDVRCLSAR